MNLHTTRKITTILVMITCLSIVHIVKAQDTGMKAITNINQGTLIEKFEYIFSESRNYQHFKVVKKDVLEGLQRHVIDSVNALREQINEQVDTRTQDMNTMASLNEKVNELTVQIQDEKKKIDSFSYLGINFSKTAFKSIITFLLLGLLGALLFMYFRFKNSNYVTKRSEESLLKIQDEYEGFKKRALEREQKMKRQIMDLKK